MESERAGWSLRDVSRRNSAIMKDLDRRRLLHSASLIGGGMALSTLLPGWARSATPGAAPTLPTLTGPNIDLRIGH